MLKKFKNLKRKSFTLLILLIILSIIFTIVIPKFTNNNTDLQDADFINQNSNIKISAQESIIQNLNKQSNLVVLETDLKETATLNDSYFNMDLFKKVQSIEYFGKGYMSIDLSTITKDDVKINNDKNSLTLYIPKPCVHSVVIDREKTKYLSIDNGLLRFGEIKLSPIDYNKLETKLIDSMKNKLSTDNDIYNEACSNAKHSITKLLSEILVSDNSLDIEFIDPYKH